MPLQYLYLAMVVVAFLTFVVVLLGVSTWLNLTGRPHPLGAAPAPAASAEAASDPLYGSSGTPRQPADPFLQDRALPSMNLQPRRPRIEPAGAVDLRKDPTLT